MINIEWLRKVLRKVLLSCFPIFFYSSLLRIFVIHYSRGTHVHYPNCWLSPPLWYKTSFWSQICEALTTSTPHYFAKLRFQRSLGLFFSILIIYSLKIRHQFTPFAKVPSLLISKTKYTVRRSFWHTNRTRWPPRKGWITTKIFFIFMNFYLLESTLSSGREERLMLSSSSVKKLDLELLWTSGGSESLKIDFSKDSLTLIGMAKDENDLVVFED